MQKSSVSWLSGKFIKVAARRIKEKIQWTKTRRDLKRRRHIVERNNNESVRMHLVKGDWVIFIEAYGRLHVCEVSREELEHNRKGI